MPKSSCEDLIYYNAIIPHTSKTNATQPVYYHKLNNVNVLDKPNNYLMSVETFSIAVQTIPVHVAEPLENDPNRLTSSITLESGIFSVTKNIIYNSTTQTSDDKYYWIFTFNTLLRFVNDTLKEAMQELKLLDVTIPIETQPPFFTYDSATQLFKLHGQKLYYDKDVILNKINFYANQYFLTLFANFDIDYLDDKLSANKGCHYLFYDKYENTWPIDNDYYVMTQEFQTASNWASFRTLELEIYSVPINNEYIEHEYLKENKQTTSSSILKNYLVLYRDNNESVARTTIDFVSNNIQYICLSGHEPLSELAIKIYWVTNKGIRHPLEIREGSVNSIKLLFKHKNLNF